MIGQTIAHYRIDAELGRGGMGVVYRAHDTRLRRDVALKLLACDAASRERILHEARAAAALNHPGIITVFEVAEAGGHVFLVMELLSGRALRAALAGGGLEPRRLARIGAQMAEALAAAHARGVVHGDIKPENVALLSDERIKLLDFGIARCGAEAAATLTRSRMADSQQEAVLSESPGLSGTLAYMAPEIMRGTPSDARADLFSLGVMLYELAAGHRPFPGPTASLVAKQILHDAPAPLTDAVATLPAELARIVHKLLEKNPESRYQSAREVQVDLANLLRDLELGPAPLPAVSGKKAVAVLPFTLLAASAEDEYLSVALADAIIHQLSAGGRVIVRPTSMVRRYAGASVDARLAARELNVQVLIEGSIQKSGPRLRVHVQAWNAADGTAFLSAKHDGEMSGLFELQDTIAGDLRRLFEQEHAARPEAAAAPMPAEAPAGLHAAARLAKLSLPTRQPMAYELYLRAVDRLSRLNRWDTRTAIELLEQATKLDARFAEAWARLGEAYVLLGTTQEPDPKWFRRADAAVRRALAVSPHNAEAHYSRGRILWSPIRGFRNRAALKALNKALQINPGCHPAVVWRSMILMHLGLHQEAKQGLLTALATQPDDAFTLNFLGQTAMYTNAYEEADEYHARAIRADRANIWANIFYPQVDIYRGRLEQAEEKLKTARNILGNDTWLESCEAHIHAMRGDTRRAQQALTRSLRGGKPLLHTHHMWHTIGVVFTVLGQPAKAVHWLNKAGKTGLPNYPLFLNDPHLAVLQGKPGFERFLKAMKKEWETHRREFGQK